MSTGPVCALATFCVAELEFKAFAECAKPRLRRYRIPKLLIIQGLGNWPLPAIGACAKLPTCLRVTRAAQAHLSALATKPPLFPSAHRAPKGYRAKFCAHLDGGRRG